MGITHIDFHFVPSHYMNEFLQNKGIHNEQIFITGIPIHRKIKKAKRAYRKRSIFYTVSLNYRWKFRSWSHGRIN
ncbi:MGDG synthase family glycosyltransferase [Bacillus cytotoxicus]